MGMRGHDAERSQAAPVAIPEDHTGIGPNVWFPGYEGIVSESIVKEGVGYLHEFVVAGDGMLTRTKRTWGSR